MVAKRKPPKKKVQAPKKKARAGKRGTTTPPKKQKKPRKVRGKPSAELVEVLMLAGCRRERILELCGCSAAVLKEDDYPDLRNGPRSAPVRTAVLLERLFQLGEASKSVYDVTHVLKIMAKLHLPEVAAALHDGKSSDARSRADGGVGGVQLYLPDNGRGPKDD